jgi:predicted enzyme related to lactoylglutathione lyase
MPDSINSGAVLYAEDIARIGAFYAAVAGLGETQRDRDFMVLERGGFQLVIVAVPEQIASTIVITDPPRRREETPIKLIFVVPDIAAARKIAADRGGAMSPSDREWRFADWRVCDGHDPEGNVFQLREPVR